MSHSPGGAGAAAGGEASAYRLGWAALNRLIAEGHSFSGHEKNCAFLNTRDGRFASVAGASGFGLADDARAVAACDWDFDGRRDFWVTNRTAPRLRLMRNASGGGGRAGAAPGADFVCIRLEGTGCNRDAIGSRVRVLGDRPLVRTLRAGEGFLGQSTKWLHFGLGDEGEGPGGARVAEVRWPGGDTESFAGLEPGGWYRLVQGRGRAESWEPPAEAAAAEGLPGSPVPIETGGPGGLARTWLVGRVPVPRWDGLPVADGRPLLVTMWSADCPTCLAELAGWASAEQAGAIRAAGLGVLALGVDGLGREDGGGGGVVVGAPLPGGVEFPFPVGEANPGAVAAAGAVLRSFVELRRPMAVPFSLLLDGSGGVAAVYQGAVPAATLLDDVALLDKPPTTQRDAAVPLAGRWASETFPAMPGRVAAALAELSGARAGADYLGAIAESAGDIELLGQLQLAAGAAGQAAETMARLFATAPGDAAVHRRAGERLLLAGQGRAAGRHFQIALDAGAADAALLFNAALAALAGRDLAGATGFFRRSLELEPGDPDCHFQLGNTLLARGDEGGARECYEAALRLRPGWALASLNFALLLATTADDRLRDPGRALELAEGACADPAYAGDPKALSVLAECHAAFGNRVEAVAVVQRAIGAAERVPGGGRLADKLRRDLARYSAE